MIPTNALLQEMAIRIGSDTVTLDKILYLWPIQEPFVPTPGVSFVNDDAASFDGSEPLSATAAARWVGTDPATGENLLVIDPPAGGWRWYVGGTTDLPQTIYGVALGDSSTSLTAGAIYGSALLEEPVELTANGDSFAVDDIATFNLRQDALY